MTRDELILAEMREHLNDCADAGIWRDMKCGDFDADAEDALTGAEIESAIESHYDGGIEAFIRASMTVADEEFDRTIAAGFEG